MADILLVFPGEEIGVDVAGGECADRERGDEFLRCARHDRPDRRAPLAQSPDEVEALVGGDAAGNDKQDAFSG